jgi:hypothetical protein
MVDVPRISLADAVRDPRVLGGTLPRGPWPMQLELLEMYEDPGLSLIVQVCGRGSTKTTCAALAAVHNAVFRPDLDGRLARGRVRYVLVAYPNEQLAREFVGRVCGPMVEDSALVAPLASVGGDRIDFALPSGARTCIKAVPCREQAVRSMSASMVLCDEFQGFGEGDGASSARAMLTALEGSCVPFADDALTVLLGTAPTMRGTLLEETFAAIQAGSMPRAAAIQAATWDVRPDIPQAYLDRRRAELGEAAYLRELGAQFITGGADGGVFDFREFEFAGDAPPAPDAASSWKVSLDPSFAGDNFGVVAVGPSVSEPDVLLVGLVAAITPEGRLRAIAAKRGREDRVLQRVAELIEPLAAVRPVTIVSDSHEGDRMRSYFGRLGYQVSIEPPSGRRKLEHFIGTRQRFADASLRCWRHPLLVDELARVRMAGERLVLPSRGSSHCDLAAALCQGVFAFRHSHSAALPMGRPSGGPPGIMRGSELPGAVGIEVKTLPRDLVADDGELVLPKRWRPGMTAEERREHEGEVERAVRAGRARERQRQRCQERLGVTMGDSF